MRPLVILCVLAMSVSASQRAAAQVMAGPFPYGGHQYYLLEATSWTNSEAEAVILGGHLATINDVAENEWVRQIFGGDLWIGLNDVNVEGTFEWVSGEPVTYTNWRLPFEPNNSGGEEHFAKIRSVGDWNDLRDDIAFQYGVVEVVPELTGDFDNSGAVGQIDLNLVLQNWGDTSPPVPAGWINEQPTGLIGQTHLNTVLQNWGNSAVASASAVPEPSTCIVTIVALCLAMSRRRR
jgi:hypothetical protein